MKILIEKNEDHYTAYPIGINGCIVAEGETFDEVLSNIKSAISFHIETFGRESLESENTIMEAFIAEANV
jgi:predicted RNase H-like HicB family nuclease